MGDYEALWRRSIDDPEQFWLEQAGEIEWITPPSRALDESDAPHYRWFPDATLNTSVNALDRHVAAGHGDRAAIIHDSAMTATVRTVTYAELLDEVARFAGVLRDAGVAKGDRVVIYLPMIPEAIVAMLACARLGAVHSAVFGGFAASELAVRLDDAKPTVVVTASGGLEPGRTVEYLPILERALGIGGESVRTVIVKNRDEIAGDSSFGDGADQQWWDWDAAVARATPAAAVEVAATDPLYILYTSGTTGNPKGVVRDNGGHAVALSWSMRHLYGIDAGQTLWSASDVGWVVGHSYIVYGPLLVGATTVIYEGKPVGTPDAAAFWRVIDDHRVDVLVTAPTAIRAIRREDPDLELLPAHDLSSLAAVYLAGERLDPETLHWLGDGIGTPVIDHWWQTETGWAIAGNPRGVELMPVKPGSATVPMPGYRVEILDAKGRPKPTGAEGNIALKLPLPPGALLGLWGGPDRYVSSYLTAFPGYYATGDSGHLDDDGYLSVMGRTDDVLNIAGHRLSTGQLEEAIAHHPRVAECAVVGVPDELKGERAVGFVTLKHGEHIGHDDLIRDVVRLVREHVGPVAAFRDVIVLDRLPKTRSGKILRKTMRQILAGESFKVPATIEDPRVLDDIVSAVGTDATVLPTVSLAAVSPSHAPSVR